MKEIAQLKQNTFLKGKNSYTLRDDGILCVSCSRDGRRQEFQVEVRQLDSEPIRDKRTVVSMIVGMSIFGLAAGGIAIAAIATAAWAALILAAFFLLPFLMCLHAYEKQSYNVVIFRNPCTGGQIAFLNNVPSVKEFDEFIKCLRAEIKAQQGKSATIPKSLSQELESLARLRENGVLTDAEFTTAKQNLIASVRTVAPIGFSN